MRTKASYILVFIMFMLAAGCSSLKEQFNSDIDAYVNELTQRAKVIEHEGDQLVAMGNSADAIDKYRHAIGLLLIHSNYKLHLDMAEHVSHGWRLQDVDTSGAGYAAGVRDNDVITAVNGVSVADMSRIIQIYKLLYDDAFTPKTLTIVRVASAPTEIKLGTPELSLNEGTVKEDWDNAEPIMDKLVAIYAKSPTTRPVVPQEARGIAVKAQQMAKAALSHDTIKAASDQFRLASLVAPWWPDIYVNYALFQNASGDAVGAMSSLKRYQTLNPQGSDMDAVRTMLVELEPKANAQRKLMDWEGWWFSLKNGRRSNGGIRIERDGNLLYAKNSDKPKPWLRATITGSNTAEAIQRFAQDSTDMTDMPPMYLDVTNRCFNGVMEGSASMTLSPNRKHLTIENNNDLDVDVSTCRIILQRKTLQEYER